MLYWICRNQEFYHEIYFVCSYRTGNYNCQLKLIWTTCDIYVKRSWEKAESDLIFSKILKSRAKLLLKNVSYSNIFLGVSRFVVLSVIIFYCICFVFPKSDLWPHCKSKKGHSLLKTTDFLLCLSPEHGSCHGICQWIHGFCAIRLSCSGIR